MHAGTALPGADPPVRRQQQQARVGAAVECLLVQGLRAVRVCKERRGKRVERRKQIQQQREVPLPLIPPQPAHSAPPQSAAPGLGTGRSPCGAAEAASAPPAPPTRDSSGSPRHRGCEPWVRSTRSGGRERSRWGASSWRAVQPARAGRAAPACSCAVQRQLQLAARGCVLNRCGGDGQRRQQVGDEDRLAHAGVAHLRDKAGTAGRQAGGRSMLTGENGRSAACSAAGQGKSESR